MGTLRVPTKSHRGLTQADGHAGRACYFADGTRSVAATLVPPNMGLRHRSVGPVRLPIAPRVLVEPFLRRERLVGDKRLATRGGTGSGEHTTALREPHGHSRLPGRRSSCKTNRARIRGSNSPGLSPNRLPANLPPTSRPQSRPAFSTIAWVWFLLPDKSNLVTRGRFAAGRRDGRRMVNLGQDGPFR